MGEASSLVAMQFDDAEQQRETATLGMWIFLATEVLFFGGLILGYTVYRHAYSDVFREACKHHMNLAAGTVNTAVLLTSSFFMALAVRSAQLGARRRQCLWLTVTIALGLLFLGIKFYEYAEHVHEHLWPGGEFAYVGRRPEVARIFFTFYFIMTGMHAVHMTIGIGVLSVLLVLSWRGRYSAAYHNPVEIGGLYWHFVDIVWIFLYPLFYLVEQA